MVDATSGLMPSTSTSSTTNSSSTSSSSTSNSNGAADLTGNYTTFLNLLTAQIKNQDPLSPMDTTQWTNQLVQYSGVEQQLKANQYLESLVNAGTQGSMNAAVGYIGKTVSADQSTSTLANGQASWQYALGGTADSATMTIADSTGTVVWKGDAPDLTAGAHTFTWNGTDSSGKALPAGDYTLSVAAKNVAGDVSSAVGITGVVTSAQNVNGVVQLQVGNTSIPLTNISGVS
ncbi:flagellar hook capping FlgD N-terminal domain-containing protein [Asticcacaulis sp. EMRT-3]|uniref:flagellar hook assembly protein FlgD n=1 Tax=Asticcacaulis sp. EMRT-3 TaxID=3040349 RepID=UPI0024AFA19D|nr:flagellar hook capping FlgD N-terminal domain-containing protein [Asticcacaulis sp. EMRT-3]MDI7775492.1 flagellar hook capping FlgD N-terminal domain-containing protein [Asticcacaulis sp. EMRT-3]